MRHPNILRSTSALAALGLFAFASSAQAQVPLRGDEPVVIEAVPDDAPIVIETLPADDLQEMVGRVALYPDDLLAVVLPASVYPLQIVQAARFLDARDRDSSLQPDPTWDESVVALLNYPEVLRMMSDDLDWTYDLGAAVVNQQPDVIAAIETFRDRAYDAGNLRSDERVVVARDDDDDAITITPVEREVVYVPYYEPERVVVVQRAPVIQYYPNPFPLYYYPYRTFVGWHNPYFYGVSTAFQIGWATRNVHFHLHNYASHPFYGRPYLRNFYYHHRFQPTRLRYAPRSFSREGYANSLNRAYRGDRWRPVGQRSVRALGQSRQRATTVNRQVRANVRTLKPRDARDRAAASTARRSSTSFSPRSSRENTRSFAANGNGRAASTTRQTTRSFAANGNGRTATTSRQTGRSVASNRSARPEATTRRTTTAGTSRYRTQSGKPAATTYRTAKPTTATYTRRATPTRSDPRVATSRTTSSRQSASTRQVAPRSTYRSTTTRQSTYRAPSAQSAPRQSATRSSAPRQSAPRQSTTRQSAPRANASRTNASRPSASRSGSSRAGRSSSGSRSRSGGGTSRSRH